MKTDTLGGTMRSAVQNLAGVDSGRKNEASLPAFLL
jgi:hypothetical protein